jgi:predicted secreted protein with PEFG-CTERM motif
MIGKLALFSVLILSISLVGSASAHKSQVIGDYLVEVGWKQEPPIVGMDNAISVGISPATPADKSNSDKMGKNSENHNKMSNDTMDHGAMTSDTGHDHADKDLGPENGIAGLAKSLDVSVSLNGKKTNLTMNEDADIAGLYIGKYTPTEVGYPSVQIFTKINSTTIEGTFHPEEIKYGSILKSISSDGSVIVNLIATAPSKDEAMDVALEFTDVNNNPIENTNYDITATQDGKIVLDEKGVHTNNGKDSHSTDSMSSANPVDIKVKLLGVGVAEKIDNWTGPKGETVSLQVVPEFGSIAVVILIVGIISIVLISKKQNLSILPRT